MKKTRRTTLKISRKWLIAGAITLILLGFAAYKNLSNPAQVALVGTEAGIMPLPACSYKLASFSAAKACPGDSFASYTYSCLNQTAATLPTSGTCVSYYDAYRQAVGICGENCQSPLPRPSCIPQPSCAPNSICRIAPPPSGSVYCPVTSPSPTPVVSSRPSPTPYYSPKPSLNPSPLASAFISPIPVPSSSPRPAYLERIRRASCRASCRIILRQTRRDQCLRACN